MRKKRTSMLIPVLLTSSCDKWTTTATGSKVKTKAGSNQPIKEFEISEAIDSYSLSFAFFLIVFGSFLQRIGFWDAVARCGRWLTHDSFKSIAAWARRQEGEK